jgi:hypothetical protein
MGKKRIILRVAIVLIVMVGCAWLLVGDMLRNNWRLIEFADHLFEYQLPPNTEVLDKQYRLEAMPGDHCSYVAQVVLKSGSSKQEISAFYREARFPEVASKMSLSFGPISPDLIFDKAKSDSNHTYVTVRIVDDENASGMLELRCW